MDVVYLERLLKFFCYGFLIGFVVYSLREPYHVGKWFYQFNQGYKGVNQNGR